MNMIILDNSSKSLRAKLGEAKVTNEVHFHVSYVDDDGQKLTGLANQHFSTGVTDFELVAAPSGTQKRIVKQILVYNADTVDHYVEIYLYYSSSSYTVFMTLISAGEYWDSTSLSGQYPAPSSGINFLLKAAPSNPAPNYAQLYYDTASPGYLTPDRPVMIDQSGNKIMVGTFNPKSYRLIRILMLTAASGTYTPSAGTEAIYVECIGGGGAGGGGATSSSNLSLGAGGGAGGYSAKWITGVSTTYPYTCGAGGTTVSGSAGNAGGDTTFNTTSVVAKGGSGGGTLAAGTTQTFINGGAGAVGSSGTGDIRLDAADGGWGIRLTAAIGHAGAGAGAPLGGGLTNGPFSTAAGTLGGTYGGGGSGALTTGTANAGGAGGAGCIRIWEFD